jgi:hypothetical protein
MRINISGISIQCLPGRLSNQPSIDALIVFATTWLKPFGEQAEEIHAIGGNRLRGACAHAAPLTLGRIARTKSFGLPNRDLIHCVVASADRPTPTKQLVAKCLRDAFHLAEEVGHRSIAISPVCKASANGGYGDPVTILSALDELSGGNNRLDLVRIIVADDLSYESYSQDVIREVSRLQHLAV